MDKPATWTSFDVVNKIRRHFNIPKVGHCGTLDPAATGLLVLMLGKYTKFAQDYTGHDKTYLATIQLGIETDSYDMDGTIIAENPIDSITESLLCDTIASHFKGEILQVPPMTSALKKDGKKLCDLARKGIEVERPSRPCTIYQFDILSVNLPSFQARIACSKGTYIRSIAHDLGAMLHCGGTLTALRRTQCGTFSIEQALGVEQLCSLSQEELEHHLLTIETQS